MYGSDHPHPSSTKMKNQYTPNRAHVHTPYVMLPHHHTNFLHFLQILKPVTLIRMHELPEDDLSDIETSWSIFKCFNVNILD